MDDGHEVGNHSLTHPDLYRLSPSRVRNEVVACQQILQSFSTPVTFRAPYGNFRWDLRNSTQFGISWLVKWDVQPAWNKCCDPALLSEEILRCTGPGSIILLHDGLFGCDEALSQSLGLATADCVDLIAPVLKARGLKFRTLSQQLASANIEHACGQLTDRSPSPGVASQQSMPTGLQNL